MNVLVIGVPSKDFVKYLENSTHEYCVLVGTSTKLATDLDQKRTYRVDFSDDNALVSAAQKLNELHNFDCTITQKESCVEKIAVINKSMGLPGNSLKTAAACTDKELMRTMFTAYDPILSPKFTQVSSLQDCRKFVKQNGYPCIIKAAGLAKSLLVIKVSNDKELDRQYKYVNETIGEVYERLFPNKKPKIIIEEFMTGSVHSVDAYADKNGEVYVLEDIVDCTTGYDIGVNDNFHYKQELPTLLPADRQEALRIAAAKGVKALKMRSSAAHVEIIMTKAGPKIVEIGARHGGKRQVMHMLANGYNLFDSWLQCNAGEKVAPRRTKDEACVLLFLVPRNKGKFKAIKNNELLLKLPSLVDFQQVTAFGEMTGKAADGFKPCVELVLHNANSTQFREDIDFIDNNVEAIAEA